MESIGPIWLAVLLAASLIWLVSASRLLRLLREHHPTTYESLDSPDLLHNNSVRNGWLSLRFLISGAYRELGDARLTRLCGFMRVFFFAYLAWFLAPALRLLLSG